MNEFKQWWWGWRVALWCSHCYRTLSHSHDAPGGDISWDCACGHSDPDPGFGTKWRRLYLRSKEIVRYRMQVIRQYER